MKPANKIRNNAKDVILKQWLDGQKVYEIPGVTKRTLQTLRKTGKIAYTMVKHKTYYRPKDVQVFLDSSKRFMKNQLENQLISLLKLVESLSGIVSEIRTHTRSIIDQSVNKSGLRPPPKMTPL